MSIRCVNQNLTWPEGESEDTVSYDNTLDAVKGPQVARKYAYQFDIKDKNGTTGKELENELYRLRGREMGGGTLVTGYINTRCSPRNIATLLSQYITRLSLLCD